MYWAVNHFYLVLAVFGSVDLGPHAHVGGDVTAVGGAVIRDPAATVAGDVTQTIYGPIQVTITVKNGKIVFGLLAFVIVAAAAPALTI